MSGFVTFYDEIMVLIVFTFGTVDNHLCKKKKNFYVNNVRRHNAWITDRHMSTTVICYETPVNESTVYSQSLLITTHLYKHM